MLQVAAIKTSEIVAGLKAALAAHDKARLAVRVRRTMPAAPTASDIGRTVAILATPTIAGETAPCEAALADRLLL